VVAKTKIMVPVVVVNSSLNALGVVRSLAPGHMPVYMVSTTRRCPAAWSRFCRVVRFPSLSGRPLINGLKQLASQIGQRPVLILTGDAEVDAVSTFREELEPLFRMSLPSKEMVTLLADKTLFQKYAEREGFPVPRSTVITCSSELQLIAGLTPPLVIKPGDKTLVLSGQVERAVRVNTLENAQSEAQRMLPRAKRLVVQEWVDGADTEIYFTLFACDANCKVVAIFSGRKLVCDPPAVGSTAVCVAAPDHAPELDSLSRHFIARVRYKGIGSLEFKLNRTDGKFVIIEPTVGRTDWQEEIATLCGANIPLATYWAEVGRQMEATPLVRGEIAWRSSIEHRVPAGLLPPGSRTVDGYFRFADPLPGLYYYGIEKFPDFACRRAKQLLQVPVRAMAAAMQYFL
jgi:predicted ATP-grasp superfamily ATP-dependent carboligase